MDTNISIDGTAIPSEDIADARKAIDDAISIDPEMARMLQMWSRNRHGRHHEARAARAKARIAKRKSKR